MFLLNSSIRLVVFDKLFYQALAKASTSYDSSVAQSAFQVHEVHRQISRKCNSFICVQQVVSTEQSTINTCSPRHIINAQVNRDTVPWCSYMYNNKDRSLYFPESIVQQSELHICLYRMISPKNIFDSGLLCKAISPWCYHRRCSVENVALNSLAAMASFGRRFSVKYCKLKPFLVSIYCTNNKLAYCRLISSQQVGPTYVQVYQIPLKFTHYLVKDVQVGNKKLMQLAAVSLHSQSWSSLTDHFEESPQLKHN